MSLLRFIILIIGIYLAYKFIFDFIIPVYRTSKRMQQQFKGMQERMNQNMQSQDNPYASNPVKKPASQDKVNSKDYIDFEEIK